MKSTTMAQIDSKLSDVNSMCSLKLVMETRNGYSALCMNNGLGRDLAKGTKTDIWNALDVIENVLYRHNNEIIALVLPYLEKLDEICPDTAVPVRTVIKHLNDMR